MSASSSGLGCAQNPDGSLKETHEIEFVHSPSTNSVELPPAEPCSLPPVAEVPSKVPLLGKVPLQSRRGQRKYNPISGAQPEQKRRNQLTLMDKITIINYAEEAEQEGQKLSQTAIAKHFHSHGFPGLSQTTVSDILKKWHEIRAALNGEAGNGMSGPAAMAPFAPGTMRVRKVRYAEVEDVLRKWQLQEEGLGRVVTGPLLVVKAQRIAEQMGVDFVGSNGWLEGFKKRYGLKEHRFHGEARSVNTDDVSGARQRLQLLLKNYNSRDTYNMDETGLFYRMPPDKGLSSKQLSGVKGDKTQITLIFCVNADGSDIQKPLFIGTAWQPHCFDGSSASSFGLYYFYNSSA